MYLGLNQNEKVETMGAKLTTVLLGSLNIYLYILAWAANLDSVKSTILFIVALTMSLIRFYYWIVRARQNTRIRELDIRIKELSIKETENARQAV